ncbi:MAG: ATP-binding protein [Firmicutes bacterium]|nr:ATP-binding protein [Bacillota bacterium]
MIRRGESAHVDFKLVLPREIGRTIASFATCGGGIIIVGVSDANEIVGLDLENQTENSFRSRVDNARASIHPSCFAEISFEAVEGKTVAVIRVPNGPRPMYYYESRPYIRDGTVSRPATPEEVEEFVLNYYFTQGLRAVVNEMKVISSLVDRRLPILELPVDSWKELIRLTSTPEQEAILETALRVYNRVLFYNNKGQRLLNQPVESLDDDGPLIKGFISLREQEFKSTDILRSTISTLEVELARFNGV